MLYFLTLSFTLICSCLCAASEQNIKKSERPHVINKPKEQYFSINVQDIAIRAALQMIADFNDVNIVVSDTVQGNITLRLDNIPWQQALDIILNIKGLGKRQQGNIIMVAPLDELINREDKNLKKQQNQAQLSPLFSQYMQINYAKATTLAELIKNKNNSMLSKRGHVAVDTRTNTLIIRDTKKSIATIKELLTVLDKPVQQVIIEARMVTVKNNINDELGIKWGLTKTNENYATSGSLPATSSLNANETPKITDRLNVNLPVAFPTGSVAFQVAKLPDGILLDLELSAIEQENKGEIIARPSITTANQKQAYIEQGVEVPYQENSTSGATSTQFKKAVLSLTVTPHITPNNKIILDLVVTQDTISSVTSNSAPAIDTQKLGTQVVVNNGETIVLGGVYQKQTINSVSKVPILGDLPYLGTLFRNSSNYNEKKELLIFVTPKIVTKKGAYNT